MGGAFFLHAVVSLTFRFEKLVETLTPLILLTGAGGYVGGRLLATLESAGHRMRCVTRHPEALRPRVAPETEVVTGDVLDANSLAPHMAGVHTAYYLVHSMASSNSFEEEDRRGGRVICYSGA